MDASDIETLCVLGAGSMGHGIAEVAAIAGYTVRLRDINDEMVQNGYEQIEWSVDKLVEGGHLEADTGEKTLERITPIVDIESALEDVDLVIEAVPERMDIKRSVYEEVDEYAPEDAILASNTSSLSISELGAVTSRPEQVCGLHFFNPPVRMELVEVVAGDETDETILETAQTFVESIDKTPVLVSKDVPGFVVNRILVPLLNEAAWLVATDEATIAEVDASAKFGLGLPMGCFELADQIGVDVILDVVEHLHDTLGDGYEPGPTLIEQVETGDYGKKTGAGFYDYEDGGVEISPTDSVSAVEDRLLAVMANETAKLVGGDVTDAATVDEAVELGGGFPNGPARMADDRGLEALLETLEDAGEQTGHPRYEVADYLAERATAGGFFDTDSSSEQLEFESLTLEWLGSDGETSEEVTDERVAVVTIDRPAKMNTITPTLLEDLDAALDVAIDSGARSLLLTGTGDRAFSAGAEVQTVVGDGDPLAGAALSRRGQAVFGRLETCPMPVVAAIDGYCFGGGMELATCVDLRLATPDSTFGQPEHNLGLLPGWGGTQRLQRLIGASRAKEIIFTAAHFDGETMSEYGFVNELVDDEDLEDRAGELALELAAGPPIAQELTKRAMDVGWDDLDAGLEVEAQAFGHLMNTDDLAEGLAAFSGKRDPTFEGK
ncbi:3-hydroxyacyl-CoA dehydrogenase NAD-binding domain-containing protein [Natrialbaceae archaeon A-chndr2]